MSLIRGITVALHIRTQTGADAFGRPTFTESTVNVDNVLVGEPSSDSLSDNKEINEKKIDYVLCIPKGDTHNWENAIVEFWGKKYKTVGFEKQYINELVPLHWNKKIKVVRYE